MNDRLIGDVCLQCGVRLTDVNRLYTKGYLRHPVDLAICTQCAEAIAGEVREAKKEWYRDKN
jgi:hypothetical protein